MRKIAVIGAGKIGSTVVDLLTAFASYEVLVIDASAEALAGLKAHPRVTTAALAIDDPAPLITKLKGCFAVVNCAPTPAVRANFVAVSGSKPQSKALLKVSGR